MSVPHERSPAREGITYLPVDVIRLESFTREQFAERYLLPGVPCIIDDLTSDWPAQHKWTRAYFKEDLGQTPMICHRQNELDLDLDYEQGVIETNLSDFIERLERGERIKHFGLSHPLFDFVATHPTLMNDVRLETLEAILPDSRFLGLRRLDSRLWPLVPPYPPHMFIAGAGSLTTGHYDPDHSYTFNWCVWGCKSVKLFAYDPRLSEQIAKLAHVDLSQSPDPAQTGEIPELGGLQGWSTRIAAGQTIFIPSRMWHFFKNEEVSMSFAVRCRSFDSLSSYSEFAADVQSPLRMMSYYAGLWRRLDFRQRSAFGHVLASFQRPLYACVWMGLKLLRLYLAGQRVLRGAVSNLRLRRKSAAE